MAEVGLLPFARVALQVARLPSLSILKSKTVPRMSTEPDRFLIFLYIKSHKPGTPRDFGCYHIYAIPSPDQTDDIPHSLPSAEERHVVHADYDTPELISNILTNPLQDVNSRFVLWFRRHNKRAVF